MSASKHTAADELPSDVVSVLQKVSDELVSSQQSECCFTVDHIEPLGDTGSWRSSYQEIAEYRNFDMLGDEDDKSSGFGHLLTKMHEDLMGDGSVIKILLDSGMGPVVPPDCDVMIHYIAYISNLDEPFDVTYIQGRRPKRFTLGKGELITGLEIGLKTMTTGERARFIIKPELAYKKLGCPPRIPPNATVLFDVHFVSYSSPGNNTHFDEKISDTRRFEKIFLDVKLLHIEGNKQFKLNNIERAIDMYNEAITILHVTETKTDEEEISVLRLMNKLYTNLSLCYLKCCGFNKVRRMGVEAMQYSVRFSKFNAKLFFNWGKALRLLKKFSEANDKLKTSLRIEPHNTTIHSEIQKLEKDEKFNRDIQHLTFDNDNDNKRLPPEFWEIFTVCLREFMNSDSDVITIIVNKNTDDIQMAKRKASSYDLQCHIITEACVETNLVAFQKSIQ